MPPSDLVRPPRRRDVVPIEKNDRDMIDDDPTSANGPDPRELSAPIVTEPMMTAPAVLGLNWGMGVPSGSNTATKR